MKEKLANAILRRVKVNVPDICKQHMVHFQSRITIVHRLFFRTIKMDKETIGS